MSYSKIGFQKNGKTRYTYTDDGIEKFLFDNKYYVQIGTRSSSATYKTDRGIYLPEYALHSFLTTNRSTVISELGVAKSSDIPSLDGYATQEWVKNQNYTSSDSGAFQCYGQGSIYAGSNSSTTYSNGSYATSGTKVFLYGTGSQYHGLIMGSYRTKPLLDKWYKISLTSVFVYGTGNIYDLKITGIVCTPLKTSTAGYPPKVIAYCTGSDKEAYFAIDENDDSNTCGMSFTLSYDTN